jgi:hypothetical protein
MRRRELLRSAAAAGGVCVAGCTTAGPLSGGTVLGRIEIINFSQVRNRIRLSVVRDRETLLDEILTLSALDDGARRATEIIPPRWGTTPGEYTLRVVHYGADGDRETSDRAYTFSRDDYEAYYADEPADPGCIGAVVKIGSDASEQNAPISISPAMVETPCESGSG